MSHERNYNFIKMFFSGGEVCDLYLKSAIEGVVIKWVTQINDVLQNDSSELTSGANPVPTVGE